MLTPLLIQMYKDTSYSGECGPNKGQDTRGGGQDAQGGGDPRAPQSSVMPRVALGVLATQRGALWGVRVQGHRRHGQLQSLCTG